MKAPATIVRSFILLVVAVIIAFFGLTYLKMPAKPDSGDQSLVIAATVNLVKSVNPSAKSQPTISKIAIVSNYALTTWLWGNSGGQAVLKKSNNFWVVQGKAGGTMDAGILVAFGVPNTIAQQLIANLAPPRTPAPSPSSMP